MNITELDIVISVSNNQSFEKIILLLWHYQTQIFKQLMRNNLAVLFPLKM